MNKKGNVSAVAILAIFIIALIFMYNQGMIGGAKEIIETEEGTTLIAPEETFHLGDYYEGNFPAYMAQKRIDCLTAGGDWIMEDDRAGCYNVPVWDHVTMCNSGQVLILKQVCMFVEGIFTCDAHEVGCEI